MNGLFALLTTIAFIALIVGLIKPSWIKMPSRKRASMIFGGAWVVFFVLFGITSAPASTTDNQPASQNAPSPATQDATAATSSVSPQAQAPETSQQKLDDTVKSQLQQTSLQVSYKDTNIANDDSDRPAGSQYVTIDINTGEFLSDSEFITDTGKLTSNIFQQVFPIDPSFYDVAILYYGQTTDQYGNTTSSLLMSYEMDKPLYGKINWSGFASLQNDIHLCAFLREEDNTLPENNVSKNYIGCVVNPVNLRSTESSIETSNPQFKDIPQYGS